jgi:hypothetical protein
MSTVVQLKRSETSGAIPTAGQIAVGELAVNLADGTLYSKKTDGSIIEVGGGESILFIDQTDMGEISDPSGYNYDLGTVESEGSTSSIIYSDSDARSAISVTDAGGEGSLTYNSSTGVITYTGPAVGGPAFRAYPSTGQTITSGSLQKVNFGGETFDTGGCFANNKFTPNVAGYYQLNSTIRLDGGSNGTGECMLVIYKNGAEHTRGWNSSGTQFTSNFWSMSVSDLVYANGTTDYFEIYIQQGSGADRTVSAYTNISSFSGCMLRGA